MIDRAKADGIDHLAPSDSVWNPKWAGYLIDGLDADEWIGAMTMT